MANQIILSVILLYTVYIVVSYYNCFLEFVHCSILEYGFILTTEFIKRISQAQLCYPDFNAPVF